MSGIVDGGWGYVVAAYGVTWGVWLAYAAILGLMEKRAGRTP